MSDNLAQKNVLTMKEAVHATGITADTIRYYEAIGIIEKIPKNDSGRRVFTAKNIEQIIFAKNMRKAGLGIDALKHYVHLIVTDEYHTRTERKELLIREAEKSEKEIQNRQEGLDFLNRKIEHYRIHQEKNESAFINKQTKHP